MKDLWKLENGIFYFFKDDEWIPLNASDVYALAFNGSLSGESKLAYIQVNLKEIFPEIRFSKFSVSPEIRLLFIAEKIKIEVFFTKNVKEYVIGIPGLDGPDYGFAENTWCYFSGDYYQIKEILQDSGIQNAEISFKQYINLINEKEKYPGVSVTDLVGKNLANSFSSNPAYSPCCLKANLYPYQTIGFNWLKYITDAECGCILGDEMGLGKTLQVIAVMADRNGVKQFPYLIVAPLSLLENWKREIHRFAPGISVLVHHGSKRTGRYTDLLKYDAIVTSYGATITDLSLFEMVNWDLLVLDEAQNIKNPDATRTQSIKQIPHRASIAVTGTPFENHMTDLWSLLDFSIPGCLGSLHDFNSQYADDYSGAERIEPLLTALMIRRRVNEVAKDLPEKVVIPQPLVMENHEALRYEDARQEILSSFNSKGATLALLTKLRMYCTHPFLLTGVDSPKDPVKASTKYARFCEIVEEIVEQNEKVIVFTSYSDMFTIFKNDIPFRFNISVDCINGSTPADMRQEIVDLFSKRSGAAMLVLNPKAAGVGLNITAANHVIHYNLEWNPALEDQATARAFRRGQEKTVFVHRLYFTDTVEEVVNEKIENKRFMSDIAVVGSEGTEDTRSLILHALGMSPLKEDME